MPLPPRANSLLIFVNSVMFVILALSTTALDFRQFKKQLSSYD
jgi:hypothetical protein